MVKGVCQPTVTEARLIQSSKANSPMLTTLLGMTTEEIMCMLRKAFRPIATTSLGITVVLQPITNVLVAVSIIPLQL